MCACGCACTCVCMCVGACMCACVLKFECASTSSYSLAKILDLVIHLWSVFIPDHWSPWTIFLILPLQWSMCIGSLADGLSMSRVASRLLKEPSRDTVSRWPAPRKVISLPTVALDKRPIVLEKVRNSQFSQSRVLFLFVCGQFIRIYTNPNERGVFEYFTRIFLNLLFMATDWRWRCAPKRLEVQAPPCHRICHDQLNVCITSIF